MARLERKIGIRSAQVRLPTPISVGPAIVRSAASIADTAFELAADKRTQEAQLAAARLNFERDAEGNLVAPHLPVNEDGLLPPSIYDRAYTQMVSQRYLQQTNIDVAERLNTIAVEHGFDPDEYRVVAEGYVAKVTELAPPLLKPDVNSKAQVRMVEHFNRIIREKGERDHKESAKLQSYTIDRLKDDAVGYAFGGDDLSATASMTEVFAGIAQGVDLHFWGPSDAAVMIDQKQAEVALSYMAGDVSRLAADPLKHAEAIERYAAFARGEGKVKTIDVDGTVIEVNVADQFPNHEMREALASQGIALVNFKEQARAGYENAVFDSQSERFFDWWENHLIQAIQPGGPPVDIDRLFAEHKKADLNGNDGLRRAIGVIIQSQYGKKGSSSSFAESFDIGFRDWTKEYYRVRAIVDGNAPATTTEELLRNHQATLDAVGNIPNGNVQTKPGSEEIADFYSAISGTKIDYEFFATADLDEIKFLTDNYMALVGIWPEEAVRYIAGNLQDPEAMNQETLNRVLTLVRTFWEHPEFRNNMQDGNALGPEMGGTLEHLMRRPIEQTSPSYVNEVLKKFNTQGFSPYQEWNVRNPEDKEKFMEIADKAITDHFETSWKQLWIRKGVQGPGWNANPLREQVDAVPGMLLSQIEHELTYHAPFINTRDPDSFKPYIKRAVVEVMNRNRYAASSLGYSEFRHGGNYGEWTRPTTAIVQNAPEFDFRDKHGTVDQELVRMATADLQSVLDVYQKDMPKGTPRFIAGENAATIYNGELSRLKGYPVYNIALIDSNGRYQMLEEESLLGGHLYSLNFEAAKQRRNKSRNKDMLLSPALTGEERLNYQNSFRDPRDPRWEGF